MSDESKPVLMLPAARWWASKGVPVFPLHNPVLTPMLEWACSCGQGDACPSPAKHPRTANGFHDASTDPATIDGWWERWPEANIGLRTGVEFDLLDIDGPAGFAVLEQMAAELGQPAALAVVESGRADGGRHFYMAPPGLTSLQQGRTSPVGVDAKTVGGYVVAPPSQHISGYRYTMTRTYGDPGEGASWQDVHAWLVAHAPVRETYSAAPERPVEAPEDRSPSRQTRLEKWCGGALRGYADRLSKMDPETGRNNYLNGAAWRLLRFAEAGLLEHEAVIETLRDAAQECGLPSSSIEATLRSAHRAARQSGPLEPDLEDDQTADVDDAPPIEAVDLETTEWEPPEPLDLTLPDFPTWTLGRLEAPVVALAEHRQVPVDMVAMMALGAVATTVRNRLHVRIRDDWTEPLNLFIGIVLPAGEAKSPTLSVITRPLYDLEKALQERAKPLINRQAQERRMQEGRLARLEKQAINATGDDRAVLEHEAFQAREALEAMPVPVLPRLLAGDMTAEALVRLLAEHDGVMASLSAEGGILDTFAGGRYSAGMANLDALLQAHDGRESIKVDRKTGDPIRVEHPCLTLLLAVQPQVLMALGASEAAMGRGLAARFLWTIPTSRVGTRVYDPSRPRFTSTGDFEALIQGVDAAVGRIVGEGSESFGGSSYRADFSLSSLSISTLYEYLSDLEPRRHPRNGDLSGIGDWAGKVDGQLARLAGLLELVDLGMHARNPQQTGNGDRPEVEHARMVAACALMDYLTQHAIAARRLMLGEALVTDDKARQVIGWAREHGLATFTVREAYQALRGRVAFRKAEAVHNACAVLEQAGWLRKVVAEQNGPGRPSQRYAVNPLEPV